MVSQSNGMPPWMTAAFDQQDAAISEVRRNSRANFEAMTRRSGASEPEVREALAWFDAQRAHYDSAVAIHAAGPEGTPQSRPEPQMPPRPAPAPDVDHRAPAAEVPVQRHETTHVHRTRFEVEPQLDQPAPGRANRLMRLPAIYTKSLAIGAGIGGVVWLILTGLLVWLLGSAWWGWWPSLLTVPIAAVAVLGWCVTVQKDINHWIKYAGREPLQSRPRFR